MSDKLKKYLKIFAVLLVAFIPFYISPVVRADSGWDSDYDSGGSWDSDYDSGSSWDSDYDYDSSSGGGSGEFGFIEFIFFIIFIIIFVAAKSSKGSSSRPYPSPVTMPQYSDITLEHLQMVMPNAHIHELKKMAFDNFVEIQHAWMNFEYDKLRELCTDELYNSYHSQLETLELKNGQNIMSDFTQKDIKVIDIDDVNGDIILTVFLSVDFYDYVINTISKQVTRGQNHRKISNNYILTFVVKSDYESKDNTKCPHCGAPINHVTSGKCEYCNSTIVKKASKFVLSKKTNVNK